MNSSAKTTAISFLATAALGAAVFMGCTVESGTVNDVDGGDQNTDTDNDAGSNTDSGPGTDTGAPATCESNQTGIFLSETCQACLQGSCCTELQGCFNLPANDDSVVDCNGYTECIDSVREECNAKPTPAEVDECYAVCDDTAAPGVQTAYEAIETCAVSSCATECGAE